jgi:hypothetical protein
MTALELTALALVSRLTGNGRRVDDTAVAARDDTSEADDAFVAQEEMDNASQAWLSVDEPAVIDEGPATVDESLTDPQSFLEDAAGEDAQFYRARDAEGAVIAGFYSDGRVRLADQEHRLAGILQNGRADLLEIADNTWSELFVRQTPEGRIQLELRGGPFDTRVLTCEPLGIATA